MAKKKRDREDGQHRTRSELTKFGRWMLDNVHTPETVGTKLGISASHVYGLRAGRYTPSFALAGTIDKLTKGVVGFADWPKKAVAG